MISCHGEGPSKHFRLYQTLGQGLPAQYKASGAKPQVSARLKGRREDVEPVKGKAGET